MSDDKKKPKGDPNLYRFGWGLDPDHPAELDILYRPSEDKAKEEDKES